MAAGIFITDTHLSPVTFDINQSIFQQVRKKANELGLQKVYHGGDIFDNRKAQPLSVLKMFEKILDDFYDDNIDLVAIPGNHDKNDYKSEDSYLDPFKHHPAFKLITKIGAEALNNKFDLILLPYFSESDTYMTYFAEADKILKGSKKYFLLTHIAVNGVKNNDGSKVDNNIKKELFAKYKNVLIGHYHNQSVICNNITYIGSAYQHNFGEDNKKGFYVIEDDGELTFIKAIFPEYKKVIIELATTTPMMAEKLINEHKSNIDRMRFVFRGTYEQVNSIDKNLYTKNGIDVKFESAELQQGVEEAIDNKFVTFDKSSIESEFKTFCKKNEIKKIEVGEKYIKQILK